MYYSMRLVWLWQYVVCDVLPSREDYSNCTGQCFITENTPTEELAYLGQKLVSIALLRRLRDQNQFCVVICDDCAACHRTKQHPIPYEGFTGPSPPTILTSIAPWVMKSDRATLDH